MSLSQVHYLPLAPLFFFILVGLFFALLVLIQRSAYMRLGISSGAALLLDTPSFKSVPMIILYISRSEPGVRPTTG